MFKEVRGKEEVFRRKNGDLFWVERTVIAVGDKSVLGYYLESWNDVTREKKLSQNLQLYATEITKAQEEERKRIARELHDETIQTLFSAVTDLGEIKNIKKSRSIDIKSSLEDIQTKIGKTIDEMRRFCHELRPGILDRFGLVPSLDLLIGEIKENYELHCNFEISGKQRRLSPEVEMVLYRTTQEALRNSLRHANATEMVVKIVFMDDKVEIRIIDNGNGFQVPEVIGNFVRDGKFGLVGMQERVRLIEGALEIDSVAGRGTRVVIEVPAFDNSYA
jgi:signal transduction histidine kinase